MKTLSDDFDDYVRSRTPALLRTAYLLSGDRHLADDRVQPGPAILERDFSNNQATFTLS